MIPKRPINRDVPPAEEAEARPEEKEEKPGAAKVSAEKPPSAKPKAPAEKKSPPKPPRQPKSQTPKLLAGLVALALVFIVVAIVFASGGSDENEGGSEVTTSAPAAGSDSGDESPSPQVAEALAFPAFATNNTTRIGGPDPVANAAGVALAVFPSTSEAQQPAAVAVVDISEPAEAIAAAVLMAPPIRAPLLFSQEEALPTVSAEALAALNPQGGKRTGGTSVFAIGKAYSAEIPVDGTVEKVIGARPTLFGRVAAIADLREKLAGPPKHIVIAPSSPDDLGFAAPAAAWAARSGDPVLFTEQRLLPPETARVLRRHPKAPVYVLGPESAVSKNVLKQIGKVSKQVKRVAGKDPVANAIALARYRDGSFGWNVNDPGHGFVLASSDDPASAPAAAALSASGTWGPLLLTDDPGRLPAAVRDYFLDVKPGYTTDPTRAFYNHVWVVGDQDAIDVFQQGEVNELAELAKIEE